MDRLDLLNKPAPAIEGTDVEGKKVSLAGLKGKVVLIDFWATWCPPCVAAVPTLKRLEATYRDRGFAILGINLDARHEAASEVGEVGGPGPQIPRGARAALDQPARRPGRRRLRQGLRRGGNPRQFRRRPRREDRRARSRRRRAGVGDLAGGRRGEVEHHVGEAGPRDPCLHAGPDVAAIGAFLVPGTVGRRLRWVWDDTLQLRLRRRGRGSRRLRRLRLHALHLLACLWCDDRPAGRGLPGHREPLHASPSALRASSLRVLPAHVQHHHVGDRLVPAASRHSSEARAEHPSRSARR